MSRPLAIASTLILALTTVAFAAETTAPSSSPPAGPAEGGMATVGAVEGRYRALEDLTAKVVQKNYLKSVDKTQTFEGILSIKRPGRLRLEYTNGQLIVIDGKEVWFYSKKNEQAIRRTFRDFEQANIPVAFLLGASHLHDDFEVSERRISAVRNTFDLVPKKKGAAMTKISMVCSDDGQIVGLTVFDKSGNTSSIVFSDVKENTGIEDKRFRFKAPKGTEILEQ